MKKEVLKMNLSQFKNSGFIFKNYNQLIISSLNFKKALKNIQLSFFLLCKILTFTCFLTQISNLNIWKSGSVRLN